MIATAWKMYSRASGTKTPATSSPRLAAMKNSSANGRTSPRMNVSMVCPPVLLYTLDDFDPLAAPDIREPTIPLVMVETVAENERVAPERLSGEDS